MKSSLLNLVLLLLAQISLANSTPPPYIEAFKDLAIQEMERTGIPASITLAQGIIESAWGKGVLARSSNNHFGIKCKKEWSGDSYRLEDDDYNTEGVLIKSCFRAYEDANASYIDHSDFLKNRPRYAHLFELDPTDYVSWAHGLQTAGYATDTAYAEKLINKIEMYELYQYDMKVANPIVLEENIEEEILEAPSFSISDEPEVKSFVPSDVIEQPASLPVDQPLETNSTVIETPILELGKNKVAAPNEIKPRMTLHAGFGEI